MITKKYFWLKLDRNFFKRHDIRIIESQENGKDYILFYLKLLVESIDHEGELRFSESVPYDEKMLSIITNTNVDIVRSAINVFEGLKMIEVLDDRTIYMAEIQKMTGSQSASTERTREYRRRKQLIKSKENCVTCDKTKQNETIYMPEIQEITEGKLASLGEIKDKQLIENKENDVTCDKMKQKCDTELETELEKDKEKKIIIKENFEKFYSNYPRKKSKDRAELTFAKILHKQKIKTQEQLNAFTNELISAVDCQKTEYRLKTEAGNKMPDWKYPATWLNDGGWKDEVDLSAIPNQPPKRFESAAERMKKYGEFLKKKAMEDRVNSKIGEIENESS